MAAVSHDAAGAAPRRSTDSSIDLVQSILRDLPALVGDRVELFSLEMQRAGTALMKITALAAAALLFALTAWLALWGLVIAGLLALGWHWASANAVAMLVNGAAAAWALLRTRALLNLLSLPATRRHLMLGLGHGALDPTPEGRDEQRPHAAEPRSSVAS